MKQDYLQMMVDDYGGLVRPFADELKAGGYAVSILEGAPAVTLSLPKQAILDLAARPEVGMIFPRRCKRKRGVGCCHPQRPGAGRVGTRVRRRERRCEPDRHRHFGGWSKSIIQMVTCTWVKSGGRVVDLALCGTNPE